MSRDIRVLTSEDELIEAGNIFRAAMIGFPPLNEQQRGLIGKLLEPGRTLGLFADGRLAATADSTTSSLTVPGGARVSHAAVTHVGVLPSYTRRGIATELLHHQLHDIAGRGEVLASLRASEATIYERFGYAVATTTATIEVRTDRAALRPGVATGGPVRLLDPGQEWDVLPRIYATHRGPRPGSIDRNATWWLNQQLRAEANPGAKFVAVHGSPGEETGFVRYHPVDTEAWFTSDQRTVVVDDLFAPTEQAHIGLLRFLLDLDLVDRLVFSLAPTDSPLQWLLRDRRAAQVTGLRDETWLRVVDVAAALRARSYAGARTVTVGIEDPLLARNSATYAISPDGIDITTAPAQLDADITALGAALLGGTSWRDLAAAGLVRVHDADALTAADELFAVPQSPYAGIYF
ncbi:GNAT family N-acetyltransferase [Mycolicibacterium bacteremicum]|uniref:GNAT family N-acetyltransferase n=1 Tax=Mycolicibacterium bacteremicum TaxID=564198 RepID=A0A1W9Z257_MYCBA|nr:GNAT family N-acetyltransferase [Mycolicibacterium bacteremicum]MCV7433233.1 GNAT family N-acetyltransferase [Mycolicibacterium bacteremicum]ORA06373.1 GNAT family N-acetyltransferase [Mycolicibacterium bacteremicum]